MSEKADLPPAPPVRGKHFEVWVGLFVIIGVASIVIALFILTDPAAFRGRYMVMTHVPNAGGIRKGDPVQMLGVNIGRIRGFTISEKNVTVRLEIEGDYPIPSDSRVSLDSLGLLGGLAANILPGPSKVAAKDGDTLQGSAQEGLMEKADDIAAEAKKSLDRVQALLSEQMVGDVHTSASELGKLLDQLNATTTEQRKELRELVKSLKATASQVEKATSGDELQRAMKRLDKLSAKAESAADTLERTSKSLEVVLGRMDRGEGTLGKLSKDDALYTNMNKTLESVDHLSVELQGLISDMKKNPKKYVKLSLF